MTLRNVVGSLSNKERLDSMVDCVNVLISLGLEPIGFKMDADILAGLIGEYGGDKRKEFFMTDENGLCDVYGTMTKYTYSIMGIPIEPLYGNRNRIEVRAKSVE